MTRWSTTHVEYGEPEARRGQLAAWDQRLSGVPWWWADVDATVIEISARSPHPIGHDKPLIFAPKLFPGGVVPEWFPFALSTSRSHALAVLGEHGESVPWPCVATEIARLYAELVPDPVDRRRVLQWHEAWLRGDGPAVDPHTALVARVGHLQVVRLRWPGAIDQERSMLKLAETVSNHSRAGDACGGRSPTGPR